MDSPYPRRLNHEVPAWVADGSVYHVRVRVDSEWRGSLVSPQMGPGLLKTVAFYHTRGMWHCRLFLLMPDHWHTLLAFNPSKRMSDVLGAWKGYTAKRLGVVWQDNYFDHRIRGGEELLFKRDYILRNPVAKGLCAGMEEWEWKLEA